MIQLPGLLLLLASLAPAQDEVYRSLEKGDRVQVTFRSGGTVVGTVVPDPRIRRDVKSKAKAPRVKFSLKYFTDDGGSAKLQEPILTAWLAKHPEGGLQTLRKATSADLWKSHGVDNAPTVILEDQAGGNSLKLRGLQREDELEGALAQLAAVAGPGGSDIAAGSDVTLDLGIEYPGLTGTMTILKSEIREIRKLQNLDPATLKRLEEERKRVQKELLAQEAERKAAEDRRTQDASAAADQADIENAAKADAAKEGDELVKQAERLKKGLELLGRFPPPKWGQNTINEIANKSIRRVPVTPEEKEFAENFTLWQEAFNHQEKMKKEKPTEEKK